MAAPERVREVREELLGGGLTGTSHDELFPIAIGSREGAALHEWVLREHAQVTLEVGLGYGIATLYICEGLLENQHDARHVAIDPYQFTGRQHQRTRFDGAGIRALEQAGLADLVEFYEEESQIVLPRLLERERHFDLAFLDGNHRFEGIFLDLIYSGRLLKDCGIAFVDDTQLAGVSKAVNFCVTNLGWSVEDAGAESDAHEWTVLRVGTAKAFQRPFTEFVEF